MGRPKVQNQEQKLGLIFPLIRNCKIFRLDTKESLEYCNKNNWKCSRSSFFEWKRKYENDHGNRFLQIARSEFIDEHLLIIDKYKEIERQYWKLYYEAESPMDAKHILDSIRATQENLIMIYNETPLIQRVKDAFDSRLKKLQT